MGFHEEIDEYQKELNEYLKDRHGKYRLLKETGMSGAESNDDYVPFDFDYPNACKYMIYSYDEELGMYESIMDGSVAIREEAIKILKKIHGIKDPWDDDPEYLKRLKNKFDDELEKRIEENIKDRSGNYYLLKLNPAYEDFDQDNFMSPNLVFADACRYFMYSINKETDVHNVKFIKDIELKDAVVKRLKKIHGIKDPWDDDPEYFRKKFDYMLENESDILWSTRIWKKNKKPRLKKFGKNVEGEIKTEFFLKSEDECEMRELWRDWHKRSDRKVKTWTENIKKEMGTKQIFKDWLIILERPENSNNNAWRLVYERVSNKYVIDDKNKKIWIEPDKGCVDSFKTYHYEDDIKVKFKRKWFGYKRI